MFKQDLILLDEVYNTICFSFKDNNYNDITSLYFSSTEKNVRKQSIKRYINKILYCNRQIINDIIEPSIDFMTVNDIFNVYQWLNQGKIQLLCNHPEILERYSILTLMEFMKQYNNYYDAIAILAHNHIYRFATLAETKHYIFFYTASAIHEKYFRGNNIFYYKVNGTAYIMEGLRNE